MLAYHDLKVLGQFGIRSTTNKQTEPLHKGNIFLYCSEAYINLYYCNARPTPNLNNPAKKSNLVWLTTSYKTQATPIKLVCHLCQFFSSFLVTNQ